MIAFDVDANDYIMGDLTKKVAKNIEFLILEILESKGYKFNTQQGFLDFCKNKLSAIRNQDYSITTLFLDEKPLLSYTYYVVYPLGKTSGKAKLSYTYNFQ